MARTLVESPVSTRASRSGLPKGTHWRGIDTDIHLGYRKNRHGGTWLVRWYTHRNRCYQRITLGVADDIVGEGNLDYGQAVKAAKDAVSKARRKLAADAEGPAPTVKVAIEDYLAARNRRLSLREGRELRVSSASTLSRHVCKNTKFVNLRLDELSEADLLKWRKSLDPNLKGTSKKRILNDLKAALNALYKVERKRLPPDLGDIIAFGLNAEAIEVEPVEVARENQILDEMTVRNIIVEARALDEDLGTLVLALAATGARFSQLKRMKVRDAQLSLKRLLVPRSLKGRNKVAGYTPIRIGADVVPLPAIPGRETVLNYGLSASKPIISRVRDHERPALVS